QHQSLVATGAGGAHLADGPELTEGPIEASTGFDRFPVQQEPVSIHFHRFAHRQGVVFVAGSQYTSRWLRFSNHELTAMLAALADPGLLRDLGRRGETH